MSKKSKKTGSLTTAQRRKAQKSKGAPPRSSHALASIPARSARVDLPDGKWIINLTEWEALYERGLQHLEADRLPQAQRL